MVGVLTKEQQNRSRQIKNSRAVSAHLMTPKVLLKLCFITTKKFEGVVNTQSTNTKIQ